MMEIGDWGRCHQKPGKAPIECGADGYGTKIKKKKEEKTWMSSNLKAIKFGWVSHSGVEAAAGGVKLRKLDE